MAPESLSPFRRKNYSLGGRLIHVLNENDIDSTSYAIARYLLDNYSRIGEVGIEEIMQACFVSRSGVRRFYRSIGFDNLSDARGYADEHARLKRLYCGYASDTGYGYSLAELVAESLANVDQLLYDGKIDELAQLIHDAREVIIVASGMSGSGLADLQVALNVLGKTPLVVTDSTNPEEVLGRMEEGDLLIVISITGYFAAHYGTCIRSCKATTALVTTSEEPALLGAFDHLYRLGPYVGMRHRSPYSSYGISFFCELLYMRYSALFAPWEERPGDGEVSNS